MNYQALSDFLAASIKEGKLSIIDGLAILCALEIAAERSIADDTKTYGTKIIERIKLMGVQED